ncbi:hypothetical protein [Nocardia sp. SSK8]|uniref:hypothetical protein n=1 Tax=Nocardia sp. SSK8 TaxID=3120154 RepID=UPI003008442F
MTSVHLLVVGPPGIPGPLLTADGRAGRVSLVCDTAELAALPAADIPDAVLDFDSGADRFRIVEHAHERREFTHVAAFDSRHTADAKIIAARLGTRLYPDFTGAAIAAPVAEADLTGVRAIAVLLAEGGEIQPVALIGAPHGSEGGRRDASALPPAGIDDALAAEFHDHATRLARAAGLRSGLAVVTLHRAAETAVLAFDIGLPGPVLRSLIHRSTGIDLAELAADQAVGLPVLDRVRAAVAGAPAPVCAREIRIAGREPIAGIDAAEGFDGVRVEVDDHPGAEPGAARAVVWARAATAGAAAELAWRAAQRLGAGPGSPGR